MKASNKIHYSKEQKAEILNGMCPAILLREAEQIARAIDSLTFRDLKNLAVAIKVFAQGKSA